MNNPIKALSADGRILATLCYIIKDGQALLLKRGKEPNFGLYTAPGGRFERGESPLECVCREMLEETGFTVQNPLLKAIVTESGPFAAQHKRLDWMLFIFRATETTGEIIECDEGDLAWIPVDEITSREIPQADKIFTRYILEESDTLRHMTFRYDESEKLVEHRII